MKKKLIILPIVWLILGAVAIATEIKTTDLLPPKQELSETAMVCVKIAADTKQAAAILATINYESGHILALTIRKAAVLAAWNNGSKKEIKWALGQASKTYNATLHELKKTFKDDQRSAKINYKSATKACKSTGIQDLIDIQNQED